MHVPVEENLYAKATTPRQLARLESCSESAKSLSSIRQPLHLPRPHPRCSRQPPSAIFSELICRQQIADVISFPLTLQRDLQSPVRRKSFGIELEDFLVAQLVYHFVIRMASLFHLDIFVRYFEPGQMCMKLTIHIEQTVLFAHDHS